MFFNWWMDKQNVMYPYNGIYYLTVKRNEVLIYAATEMDLEDVLLERSQSQRGTCCVTPFI